MGRVVLTVVLALSLTPRDIKWKTNWAEGLKEAKSSNKLAVLYFYSKSRKDCIRFEAETLPDPNVVSALGQYVCVKLDPETCTDDENALWQKLGQALPPMTYVFDPDGKLLTSVSALKAEFYAGSLAAAGPAYFKLIVPAKEALARDPNQADKLAMLGEAYQKLENKTESTTAYGKAVDLLVKKGDKAGALKVLGGQLEAYYNGKWYVPAKDACKRIAELDPADSSKLGDKAVWVLGMAACDERKYGDAITIMKPACERYKDSPLLPKMMFTLGSGYMYSKDKDGALAVFDEIVKKFPGSETANIAQIQADKLRSK